jgi:beta-lactam-binding protein with PASTA domain
MPAPSPSAPTPSTTTVPPTASPEPAPVARSRFAFARGGPAVVPSVDGFDAVAAIRTLLDAGFVPAVRADRDARARAGRVRAQQPSAGQTASGGDVVVVWVGSGWSASMADVPDVTGTSAAAAQALLTSRGSSVQFERLARAPGVASGVVVSQYPVGSVARSEAGVVTVWVAP